MAVVSSKSSSFIFIAIGAVLLLINFKFINKDTNRANEIAGKYKDVSSASVNRDNDGSLVVLSGTMSSASGVDDSVFGVHANGVKLKRKVELYQWIEDCEVKEQNNEKVKECEYSKEWRESIVNSSEFESDSYANPKEMPYEKTDFYARDAKLGAFELSESLLKKYTHYNDLDLSGVEPNLYGYIVIGDYITNTSDMDSPRVGDVRVSYQYSPIEDVTVMAKQDGSTLSAYATSKGDVFEIKTGIKNGEEMVEAVKRSGNGLRWFAVIVGVGAILLGVLNFLKKK